MSKSLTKWLFGGRFCVFLSLTDRLTCRRHGVEVMPAKTCRHGWRHGTPGDVRHVACPRLCSSAVLVLSPYPHFSCSQLCAQGRKPLSHDRGSESRFSDFRRGSACPYICAADPGVSPSALRVCRWDGKGAFSLATFRSYCSRRGAVFRFVWRGWVDVSA